MRSNLAKLSTAICCLFFLSYNSSAQNCIPTNIDGSVFNLACNQTCKTLVFQIPHIKGTDDYVVTSIPYTPYPYTTSAPGLSIACTNQDDKFFDTTILPFNFCFYGAKYSRMVVSTNGLVTFDSTNALKTNTYGLSATNQLPFTGSGTQSDVLPGCPGGGLTPLFPRACIMGAYYDIDIDFTSTNKKMEVHTEGSAPCRRIVISFFEIPLFSCTTLLATQQIVLHESTGIVEVYIGNKPSCTGWNGGLAILGMQDWSRTKAVTAPGKNCTQWSESSKGYRFTPSGPGSRYVSSQIFDMAGNLIATADTSTTTLGLLDLSFPNICSPAGSTQYVIKTTFSACDNPANQLISTDNITINRTNGLNATSTFTDATCGPPNGTITVTIPAGVGTPPYTYILDGGTPVTAPSPYTFTGVGAGPHTIVVTDASGGCTSTLNVTINLSSNINANTSTTSTACTGISNGTITVAPTNGSAPYQYTLDSGTPITGGNPYTFTGLASGTHTILVRDASGCVSNTINVTISVGPGISTTITPTATTCATATNGTILVNATTGLAPFTYQLDAGAPQSGTNPYTFSNVPAGSHTILVTDAVGCTKTTTITVSAGPSLNANMVPTSTSCSGATDGIITVTPTNGTAPYDFSIDAGGFVPGTVPYTFSNLTAGSHTVSVKDASGCTKTSTITVSAGTVLAANAVPATTSCSGASDGTITVTPTNGTGPFEFALDAGGFIPGTVPYTFSGLAAGPHTILVRNASGCVTNSIPVNVDAGPNLTTSLNKTDVACFAGTTGSITVTTPVIGAAPYQYSLDGVNWQSSNIFNGLVAGTYTVYYKESAGCMGSQSVTITEPPVLSATASSVAVVCNGQNNGIVTVNSNGGVLPYQYSIDGGTNWQSSNIFNMAAGSYIVTIKDANGCTTTQNISVTEPPVLTAFSNNTSASCDGGSDGTIVITANGGNSNYTYSIDGTNFQPSNTFNVSPGSYTVTVKDNLGCTTTFNATVTLANNLTFTQQTDPTICEGGSIQLDLVSNATQYVWTPRIAINDTTIHNPVVNPVTTTQYVVSATLGRCTANDTVMVYVDPAPTVSAGVNGFICAGQTYQLAASGGVQYLWTPSTYLDDPTSPTPVSSAPKTITYTLSVIADANGCKSLVSDDITIDVTPPFKVHPFPFDTIGYPGDKFQLMALADEPDATIFTWTPATNLSDPGIYNPIVTVGSIGQDIQYQVIAETPAGCKGAAYITIKVYKGPDIYVPTGFTPNNDGKNDLFMPFPVGIKAINYFRVFNRWGQLVFSTTRLHDGWDGKIQGKEQSTGTYVWMIEVITDLGKVITKRGTVTLIR